MHDFVAKHGYDKSPCCDNDDACPSRHVVIDGMDQLSPNNHIDGRPANASKNVEHSDDFDTVEAEEITRENHLAQAKAGAEGGEEGDGRYGEEVHKKDGEEGVDEAEVEDRNCEGANGEGGDDHVGGEPLIGSISCCCGGLHIVEKHGLPMCPFSSDLHPFSRLRARARCLAVPHRSESRSAGSSHTMIPL